MDGGAEVREVLLRGLGAPRAEGDVVLGRAALVAVAGDEQRLRGRLLQAVGELLQPLLRVAGQRGLVEPEADRERARVGALATKQAA